MPTIAYQVHRTAERLRLRVPDRRHDSAFFAELSDRLSRLPGVIEVSGNPVSAGVLIRLDPTRDPTREQDPIPAIEAAGLIRVIGGPPPLSPGLTALRRAAMRIDRELEEQTGGSADLRMVAFLLLVALALGQALRGQLLAPAASLLWYAYELLRFVPPAPDEADQTGDAPRPE
jgi:hypothetical protein